MADVRRLWPQVLDEVKSRRRFAWILLSQNAQVIGLEGNVLTVGLKNQGARDSFAGGGSDEILRQALIDVIGVDWRVEAIIDPSADPAAQTAPRVARPAVDPTPPPPAPVSHDPEISDQARAAARANIAPMRQAGEPVRRDPGTDIDADVDRSDADADDSGASGAELLMRELGATVIEEIQRDPQ